jgi:hypothetical protein
MKLTLVLATLLVVVSPLVLGTAKFGAQYDFVEKDGTVWLERQSVLFDTPPVGDTCDDTPRIDHIQATKLDLDEDKDNVMIELFRKGQWAVRPLHVWGIYTEIGCKEPIGWGTAFLIGYYKNTSIWLTVEHNVDTAKYFQSIFGRVVATDWFIQDNAGSFRELRPIGCKPGKFCVLISGYISGTSPLGLDDDIISNDIKVLTETYLYGCSVQAETVKRYEHYRLYHFCLGNAGYVNSRESIPIRVGGDFLVSNPAMPGFSGTPVLIHKDDRFLIVGTVNAGVEGVFTAVNFVAEDTLRKVKDWLKVGEKLFGEETR